MSLCLFAMLLCAPAAGTARGQATPGTDATSGAGLSSPGESDARQERTIPPHEWRYPNAGADAAVRSDRVYQAFPPDRAVFTIQTAVTLGWQPVTEAAVNVQRYEVFIAGDNGYQHYLRPGQDAPGKPTCALFFPPGPATYFWQVWAVLSNGQVIASVGRRFEVAK